MSLLKVNKLSLGYDGKNVINSIDFQVNEGDYLCVVGENGSGKTTLIKGILGLISKQSGSVEYGDGLLRNHIGYLSQQPLYSKDFPASVREIVLSGFLNNRVFGFGYTKSERDRASEIMTMVGVRELEKKSFAELSGGQQQRVLLARALCAAKKLILLDEPTSALDPIATADFYSLVKRLNHQGIAVIMVSHDVNAAVRNASHILYLDSNTYFFGTTHQYMHSDLGSKLLISDCPCDDCSHSSEKAGEDNA